jgi:hypothetical protein
MAQKARDNYTPSGQPAEPPVQTDSGVISGELVAVEAADSGQFVGAVTITLRQLMRPVTALPLRQFMPLSDAFAQAKNRLGVWSDDLAARELWQHARHRRLTVAARQILPGGTEQVFILKSAFWQYFAIETIHPFPDVRLKAAVVRGRIWPASLGDGRWYFFVGRRRFDRCYSTAAPSKPAAQAPASSTSLTPRNPRGAGAKRDFDREFILIEAAAYVWENGLPSTLEELVHALQLTLGDKVPRDTQGKKILAPFFQRMKQALGR